MSRFIIFSPSYNENAGGVIALHKLCHILRGLGFDAYINPQLEDRIIGLNNMDGLFVFIKAWYKYLKRPFKVNDFFNTPIFKGDVSDNDIVIYPEVTFGNPLKAKNVVRWLLNRPGQLTNNVFFGLGELYFKFDHGLVEGFSLHGSKISDNTLNVMHIPFEIYNENETNSNRNGYAYSVRKGKHKTLNQHPSDAICIDGLSHHEVASIFKQVKCFISYDAYSAYSLFAALCGCDVVIIPESGVTKEQWYPNEKLRYGLAYGFDDLDWARETRHLLLPYRETEEKIYENSVRNFVDESLEYFDLNNSNDE